MRNVRTIFLMLIMVSAISCSETLKDSGFFDNQSDTSAAPDDSATLPSDSAEPPVQSADGESCDADADCDSSHCECVNFDCSERVCAPVDCLCGYGTSGSCEESLMGMPDPEDCDGVFECETLNECIPFED